jgi:transmembrane sensor
MNSSPEPRDVIADEQAALWAARLDGDTLDRAERAELDAWLAQKPAHRRLLSEYCQFSADLEEQIPALVLHGAVAMPAKAPARRQWTFPRVFSVALAAAAAVAVTAFVVRPTSQIQNVAKASAERGAETLVDGTRVELNANTSLRFDNSKSEREATLASGEALFAVAKDQSRPFIVKTPAGTVRVTGTTFNVRTDPVTNVFEVTVIEGSVQVSPGEVNGVPPPAPMSLSAGDRFSSRRGERQSLSQSELDDALAWRQGVIVFDGVPLHEAAARFSQYHGRAINVAPAVAGERVSGRRKLDDLTGFLAGLELALPRVKVHADDLSGTVSVNLRPGS